MFSVFVCFEMVVLGEKKLFHCAEKGLGTTWVQNGTLPLQGASGGGFWVQLGFREGIARAETETFFNYPPGN